MSQQPNKTRRKVLKNVGAAGGAAAVGVWTKPSLNSVVLPAHATTSMITTVAPLGGGTSGGAPVVRINRSSNNSIASKALDMVIPNANAAGFIDPCAAFTENGDDDYRHCIQLSFEEAAADTGFTFDLTGPDIYYNFCGYGYEYYYSTTYHYSFYPYSYYYTRYSAASYSYYEGVKNLSDSGSGTLSGQDINILLGDYRFVGTVSDDFETAAGTVVQESGDYFSVGNYLIGTNGECTTGYGAYWSVTLDGTSCSPGAGAFDSGREIVVESYCKVR